MIPIYEEKEIITLHGFVENVIEKGEFWDKEEEKFYEDLYQKLSNHLYEWKQPSVLIF